MAYYSRILQEGMQGEDVKAWQNFLKSQGYRIDVDGIFGRDTKRWTMHYQNANGLGVDGVVGENTLGKAGYSSINTNYIDTTEGKDKRDALDTAMDNFTNFGQNWEYADVNKQLLNDYLNRDPFSYDLNGDALYQQYKDKYIQQGKLAMQDTMGQASAMTGGFGSSFAQSVGQQAYQNSLDNLNDIVPELYQMAYDRYNQRGQDMLNQLGVLDVDYTRGYDAAKDKYGVASDDYYNSESSYNADRSYANILAQKEEEQKKNNNVTGGSLRDKTPIVPPKEDNPYTYKETSGTLNFQHSVKTKNDFYTKGGSDKVKYGTYENYIEGLLDQALRAGRLSEDEVATLLAYYGLA